MASAGLLSISAANDSRRWVNTIGVVVDALDPCQTRGSSYCVTFTIKDCEFDAPSWQGGLRVKYFNDDASTLPPVQQNDVVLLRHIKVNEFRGSVMAVASQKERVSWAIFRLQHGSSEDISITRGPGNFDVNPEEKKAATLLLKNLHGEGPSAAPQQPSPALPTPVRAPSPRPVAKTAWTIPASATTRKSGGPPFSLIQDVQPGRLNQLLGQVVKINTYDTEKTVIYLTDYTANPSLNDIRKEDDDPGVEGDAYGYLARKKHNWPGPWGQLSLQIVLWEPHATFARQYVKDGNLILLTYVHIKNSPNGGIEAAVHRDKRFEDKIHVRIVSEQYDDQTQQLMDRRKAYWKIHGEPKSNLKKADRKAAAKQKKSQQKTKEVHIEEGQKVLPAVTSRKKNSHIKCRDYGVPIRSVESIVSAETHINHFSGDIKYTLPFQNVCYQVLVRVVDFYPPNLEDFAVQVPMESILDHEEERDEGRDHQYMSWEWRFCLLVEGTEPAASKDQPRELMKIFVTGGEGDHLLNMDAVNLRNNPGRVHELKEKLFLLWGDLEESKEATATIANEYGSWAPVKSSSLPFTCCIKEYGVRCSHEDSDTMAIDGSDREICSQAGCFGWERRFAMFGTTIHS